MKINLEDFKDFIRTDSWEIYASETIDFKDFTRLRLLYNANNEYKVTKKQEVIYFGSDIEKAINTYNSWSYEN